MFKIVNGFDGLYSVSEKGEIYSHPKESKYVNHNGMILKPINDNGMILKPINDNGYLVVSLHKNKKQTKSLIHRIVAESFLPNPYNLPEVNHIDGNKLNNNVENLEWCTSKYNSVHAQRLGLNVISEKNKKVSSENMKKWNNSKKGKEHCLRNGRSRRKLSEKQIHDILHQCKVVGKSAYSICKEYGVSKPTILRIVRGETYKEFQL